MVFSIVAILVLIPYFLFQTNFVYEVSGAQSWSIPLSGYRMNPTDLYASYGYIEPYSATGAQWVSTNLNYQYNMAADVSFFTSITAYGLIYRGYVSGLGNTTVLRSGEIAFLSYFSVDYEPMAWNGSLNAIIYQTDTVYSNGGCLVQYKP